MEEKDALHLERDGDGSLLVCESDPSLVGDANAYLGYLGDRNYSPRTVRAYGYGLLAFFRWLRTAGLTVPRMS